MARQYYDSVQSVYNLFINHPALSQMLGEFQVPSQGVKEVAEFLFNNDKLLQDFNLRDLYGVSPNTLEPDQDNPNPFYVTSKSQLPETNNKRVFYVIEEDVYYKWDEDLESWVEDPNWITFTSDEYKKYQQETGFLIWEYKSGYFILVEGSDGLGHWESLGNIYDGDVVGSVIRESDLPMDGVNLGDVYFVKGEDLIDVIATLYGFTAPGYKPPWVTYSSSQGTNLLELLKFTIYYYRYATVDNFYETNIFNFIPEYDRNIILSKPKMKLFLEAVGRNLDNLEDKISRIPNLYDLNEVPEQLLDYVGQILGYEREDFTLQSVSFRELLKNIIEIYKIKGTNYSFSFFFKFLGFNINLKEFYFNRDVSNPESFPGIDNTKVEYYLTTTNPTFDTSKNNPAEHLEQIRNLGDWEFEYEELRNGGCYNILEYMTGRQSYNLTGKWHDNPWTYFKTNLIEYQLDPFMDKINLTASDNETIRKYIRFLSPTYLFTWVNINLQPWVESYDVHVDLEEKLHIELNKTMGDYVDPETGDIYLYSTDSNSLEWIRENNLVFQDHEEMKRYLDLYRPETYYQFNSGSWEEIQQPIGFNGFVENYEDLASISSNEGDIYKVFGGERMISSIVYNNPIYGDINNPNYTGHDDSDYVGTVLRRNGVHIRQPGHPRYINNKRHNGDINLSFDNLGIFIKEYSSSSYNYEVSNFESLPVSGVPLNSLAITTDNNNIYIYKNINNYWEKINLFEEDFVGGVVSTINNLPSSQQEIEQISLNEIWYVSSVKKYYVFLGQDILWQNFNINSSEFIKGEVTFYSQLLNQPNTNHLDIFHVSSESEYYKYIETEPQWYIATSEERLINWKDYSYRPLPAVPINVDPYPGTIVYNNNPHLIWDNIEYQHGFFIQISYDLGFEDVKEEYELDSSTTNLQLENYSNSSYYWRARTKNHLGEYGEYSNIFDFIIESTPHPFNSEEITRESKRVSIVRDGQDILGVLITLEWDLVFRATEYDIQISSEENFDTILYSDISYANNIKIQLPNNSTYYWRVRALKDEWLDWQGPFLFKTRL